VRRALRSAALLLAAACGSGTLDSAQIAGLGGGPGVVAAAAPARVAAPAPVRLTARNFAKLPPKRAGVPRVVFLGDSIAAGFGLPPEAAPYPDLLGRRLADEGLAIEVLNGGVLGCTSSGGLVLTDLGCLRPDIVVLELGGNDFLLERPLDTAHDNLKRSVELGRALGAQVLLVGVQLPPFLRETERGAQFDRLYTDLATELAVPLVPDMFADALGNPRFMQHDQIHPTAEGQMVVAENLLPGLRPLVEAVLGR